MRWVVLVAFVGCQGPDGAPGPEGPPGPVGATGPTGAPGGGYHWVDADGEVVTSGAELVYVDEAGFVWGVDPEAGELTVALEEDSRYDSDDCSGPAVVLLQLDDRPVPPRVVVMVDDDYFARGDRQVVGEVCWESIERSDGCEDLVIATGYTACADGFQVAALDAVEHPGVSWMPPLHPEAF